MLRLLVLCPSNADVLDLEHISMLDPIRNTALLILEASIISSIGHYSLIHYIEYMHG